jgi:DNA-binding transcriptional ArsR family regulator
MPTTESTETASETTDTTSETTDTATETTGTATETTGTATETTETTTETTETATETTDTATETTETTETAETATATTAGESDADAETAAFVTESSRRTAVLERLVTGPASAADIATRDAPSVEGVRGVTGTLSASKTESTTETLRDRGLVELLVDGDTRVYSLTAKGERILFTLEWDEG